MSIADYFGEDVLTREKEEIKLLKSLKDKKKKSLEEIEAEDFVANEMAERELEIKEYLQR